MIKLIFTVGRETILIEIEQKTVIYRDRRFPKGILFMPKAKNFDMLVLMSRNRIPKEIIELINDANSGKNLVEYQNAKDDETLVEIVIRDAKSKGCVFQKREDFPNEIQEDIKNDIEEDVQKEIKDDSNKEI